MESRQRISIFISSPSDLKEERKILVEYIENKLKIADYDFKVIVWEKNLPSMVTNNAQQVINESLLKPSDMLIGIFKRKFGTPTQGYESGTVEEIEKFISDDKPVSLYFIDSQIGTNSISHEELENLTKIHEFKDKYKDVGVYVDVSNVEAIIDRLPMDVENGIKKIIEGKNIKESSAEKSQDIKGNSNNKVSTTHDMFSSTEEEAEIDNLYSEWYLQSIADLINDYIHQKDIDYNYKFDITFRENLLLAKNKVTRYMESTVEEILNTARRYAFNKKYGKYNYKNDLRNTYKDWHKPIRDIIDNYFKEYSELSVLDVGGNYGVEVQQIFAGDSRIKATVLDLSEDAIKRGKSSFKNIEFVQANMEKDYLINQQYDVCLSLRTIQSTGVFRQDALLQMSKKVKLNGIIIISLPNGYKDKKKDSVIRGLYDYGSKTFIEDQPFTKAGKVERKLRDYGFGNTKIVSGDTEILVWAVKMFG